MQFMIMTVSIYTHQTMVWSDVGENVTASFFEIFIFNRFHLIEQNIQIWEKLNERNILTYLLCTTLNTWSKVKSYSL